MPVLPGILRVDATYRLGDDGRLEAELPIRKVPVRYEGNLYGRIARLVDAPAPAIAAAATRFGPLGPVVALSIPDRPGFLLTTSRRMRAMLDRIPKLHRWMATAGQAAIKGRDAVTAHAIAAYAEADPQLSAELVDWLSSDGAPLNDEDRNRLLAACDVLEELCLTALSRRIGEIVDDLAHPDRVTMVHPTPTAARRLRHGARLFSLLATKADEIGPASEVIPPDRLGSLGTELAPYFPDGNIVPAESVDGWRAAARLLAAWTRLAHHPSLLSVRQRRDLRDALAAQLQGIDAWPLPTGDTLGAYARALWALWPIFGDSAVPRACEGPACPNRLPSGAHGNQRFCQDHVREHDRRRAARNRARRSASRRRVDAT